MTTIFKKAMLGTALAATAAIGVVASATPAAAHEWGERRHGGDGAAIAVGAGLLGLVIGAAIASDHHDRRAYVNEDACYDAYPGYDGYCYPASYYTSNGWGWREGAWWYGGTRYARPFVVGGYRGGYTQYRGYQGGGYYGGDNRRGYEHDGDRRGNWGDDRGYQGGDRGYQGGDRGNWGGNRGYQGGDQGRGGNGWGGGDRGGDHDHR
ncbi:hypothetical protein [Novosphingobium sp.]|uniref:hypothetical protein n=1 Tax=Novosphingobium sp. TaxID=1874826 RepID=UPI003340363B